MIKASEMVRRLEDSIDSLREENKKLRGGEQKEFMITYKWQTTELPTEWNKEWDMYTISYKDRMTGKIITDKWVRYKNKWRNPVDVERMISDERDEIIDHQKRDIVELRKEKDKLKEELWARVKQVEDLQSSYKVLQEENKKLKSKLEQTVDEYDEDYQTFHKIKYDDINYDKRLKQHMREIMKSRLDDMFNKWRW